MILEHDWDWEWRQMRAMIQTREKETFGSKSTRMLTIGLPADESTDDVTAGCHVIYIVCAHYRKLHRYFSHFVVYYRVPGPPVDHSHIGPLTGALAVFQKHFYSWRPRLRSLIEIVHWQLQLLVQLSPSLFSSWQCWSCSRIIGGYGVLFFVYVSHNYIHSQLDSWPILLL